MAKEYICLNCNKSYTSRKKNSKWCSIECKREYNQIPYNCDQCGKKIIITRGKLEKLKNGERHALFCSANCHNEYQVTSEEKICIHCGKKFSIWKCMNSQQFCSRKCFDEYRFLNSVQSMEQVCKGCGSVFHSDRIQDYCSTTCRDKAQMNRLVDKCAYCGKTVERKRSDMIKPKKIYCSKMCHYLDIQWNEKDKDILKQYYHKIPTRNIIPLLSKPYGIKNLNCEAEKLGLTSSREWSQDEVDILNNLYPSVPMNDVISALPNRSMPSILGKAHTLGLKSYTYYQTRYTEDDIAFIKANYLSMTDEELAEKVGRTANAIKQTLWKCELYRPFDPTTTCYKDISRFVRARIEAWRNKVRNDYNYTCVLTGTRTNIIVHHCRSFNILLQEAIESLSFTIRDDFSLYREKELVALVERFLELQEYYGEYVCVNETLHKLFHKLYGNGNNTMEQWLDFSANYKSNKYNNLIDDEALRAS